MFIDGMVKKWGGELVGVDYAQLAREGEASRAYLLERFGVPLPHQRPDCECETVPAAA